MTEADEILRDLAMLFFSAKQGTKIERTKGNKKVTISVKKVEKL